MKYCKTALAILAAVSASLALADDFKTIKGKEYKNAKVSRIEPDGVVLITKSGISKVYFTELPKEVQERFNYDPEKAAQFEDARRLHQIAKYPEPHAFSTVVFYGLRIFWCKVAQFCARRHEC